MVAVMVDGLQEGPFVPDEDKFRLRRAVRLPAAGRENRDGRELDHGSYGY